MLRSPSLFTIGLILFIALAFVSHEALAESRPQSGGDEILKNASFTQPGKEDATPEHWVGPILLEAEHDPPLAELILRSDVDAVHGDFAAYLRYSSTVADGWTGVAYEQSEAQYGQLSGPADLLLTYRIRYQYGAGIDHISDHAAMIELELQADGDTYRLRYMHPRHGELPEDHERTVHLHAGDPGFRTWTPYEHSLDQDIAQAFPLLESYHISAVRVGILAHRTGHEQTRLYWMLDYLQLVVDDA